MNFNQEDQYSRQFLNFAWLKMEVKVFKVVFGIDYDFNFLPSS